MATGSISALKSKDISITVVATGIFKEEPLGVSYDRVKSAFLEYNDDVYYTNPVIAIRKDTNKVAIKLSSATNVARTYTVRIFYI